MTLKEWSEIFSDDLAECLEKRGMSQNDLAKASGISIGSINSYIHGQAIPSLKAVINIAYALDMDIGELVDFGDSID